MNSSAVEDVWNAKPLKTWIRCCLHLTVGYRTLAAAYERYTSCPVPRGTPTGNI